MPLDDLGGCLGSIGELLGDIFSSSVGEFLWWWFGITGSAIFWVLTFGQVWLMDRHEHLAGFLGLFLHIGLIAWLVSA